MSRRASFPRALVLAGHYQLRPPCLWQPDRAVVLAAHAWPDGSGRRRLAFADVGAALASQCLQAALYEATRPCVMTVRQTVCRRAEPSLGKLAGVVSPGSASRRPGCDVASRSHERTSPPPPASTGLDAARPDDDATRRCYAALPETDGRHRHARHRHRRLFHPAGQMIRIRHFRTCPAAAVVRVRR